MLANIKPESDARKVASTLNNNEEDKELDLSESISEDEGSSDGNLPYLLDYGDLTHLTVSPDGMKMFLSSRLTLSVMFEIAYMIISGIFAACGLAYTINSCCMMEWIRSIQSISLPFKSSETEYFGYTMLEQNGYEMIVGAVIYYFLGVIMFTLNAVATVYGGWKVLPEWQSFSCLANGIFLGCELLCIIGAFLLLPSECSSTNFRKYFTEYFKWYGILSIHENNHGHSAMHKIEAIQVHLKCCGIDGYRDYENIFVKGNDSRFDQWFPKQISYLKGGPKTDLDYYRKYGRDIASIPHSCCSIFARQTENCSLGIFEIERKTGIEVGKRVLLQRGCVEAGMLACSSWLHTLTTSASILFLTRFLLYVCFITLTIILKRFYERKRRLVTASIVSTKLEIAGIYPAQSYSNLENVFVEDLAPINQENRHIHIKIPEELEFPDIGIFSKNIPKKHHHHHHHQKDELNEAEPKSKVD